MAGVWDRQVCRPADRAVDQSAGVRVEHLSLVLNGKVVANATVIKFPLYQALGLLALGPGGGARSPRSPSSR
jgi:hypothetical protein